MFPTPKLNALRAERARALEAYARVELSLCELFASLIGTSPKLAGVAFFRISSMTSVTNILESLLKKKFGSEFSAFWQGDKNNNKGALKQLRALSGKRNEIVHWTLVNFLDGQPKTEPGPEVGEWHLMPPNMWDLDFEKPFLTTADLEDFTAKADFFQHSIWMFVFIHCHKYPFSDGVPPAWPDIFRKPCIYPPPEDHPIFPRWKAREIPPRSSPA